MICTVIFCLVFTALAKWRVELRAKIGQYRNRCFPLSNNECENSLTVTAICASWMHMYMYLFRVSENLQISCESRIVVYYKRWQKDNIYSWFLKRMTFVLLTKRQPFYEKKHMKKSGHIILWYNISICLVC